MDIRQAKVSTTVTIGQRLVVDAQLVQNCRPQVINGRPVFNGVISQVVGRAISDAPLDAPAGHPDAEAERVVVSTICPLCERRATEFSRPDNQRLVEQAASFQVLDQAGSYVLLCMYIQMSNV